MRVGVDRGHDVVVLDDEGISELALLDATMVDLQGSRAALAAITPSSSAEGHCMLGTA